MQLGSPGLKQKTLLEATQQVDAGKFGIFDPIRYNCPMLEFKQGGEGGKEKWLDPRTWSKKRWGIVGVGSLALVVAAGL